MISGLSLAAPAIGLGAKLLMGGALVASIMGLLTFGIHQISAGGYARAEAARRADIAAQNTDELRRERALRAAGAQREAAVRQELTAAGANRVLPAPTGKKCVPGCTR